MDEYEVQQIAAREARQKVDDLRYELGDRISGLERELSNVRDALADEREARRIGDAEGGE